MWQTACRIEGRGGGCLVRRFAVIAFLSVVAATFSWIGASREAHAAGTAEALTVQVTGGALSSIASSQNPPPGWYLTGNFNSAAGSATYAMVLDNQGTPVWYRKTAALGAVNVTPLPNGTIAWMPTPSRGFGTDPDGAFEEYDLSGRRT